MSGASMVRRLAALACGPLLAGLLAVAPAAAAPETSFSALVKVSGIEIGIFSRDLKTAHCDRATVYVSVLEPASFDARKGAIRKYLETMLEPELRAYCPKNLDGIRLALVNGARETGRAIFEDEAWLFDIGSFGRCCAMVERFDGRQLEWRYSPDRHVNASASLPFSETPGFADLAEHLSEAWIGRPVATRRGGGRGQAYLDHVLRIQDFLWHGTGRDFLPLTDYNYRMHNVRHPGTLSAPCLEGPVPAQRAWLMTECVALDPYAQAKPLVGVADLLAKLFPGDFAPGLYSDLGAMRKFRAEARAYGVDAAFHFALAVLAKALVDYDLEYRDGPLTFAEEQLTCVPSGDGTGGAGMKVTLGQESWTESSAVPILERDAFVRRLRSDEAFLKLVDEDTELTQSTARFAKRQVSAAHAAMTCLKGMQALVQLPLAGLQEEVFGPALRHGAALKGSGYLFDGGARRRGVRPLLMALALQVYAAERRKEELFDILAGLLDEAGEEGAPEQGLLSGRLLYRDFIRSDDRDRSCAGVIMEDIEYMMLSDHARMVSATAAEEISDALMADLRRYAGGTDLPGFEMAVRRFRGLGEVLSAHPVTSGGEFLCQREHADMRNPVISDVAWPFTSREPEFDVIRSSLEPAFAKVRMGNRIAAWRAQRDAAGPADPPGPFDILDAVLAAHGRSPALQVDGASLKMLGGFALETLDIYDVDCRPAGPGYDCSYASYDRASMTVGDRGENPFGPLMAMFSGMPDGWWVAARTPDQRIGLQLVDGVWRSPELERQVTEAVLEGLGKALVGAGEALSRASCGNLWALRARYAYFASGC